MIQFISFIKPSGKDNELANKWNMVADTLEIIILFSRRDTPNNINFTCDPAEHTFGSTMVLI